MNNSSTELFGYERCPVSAENSDTIDLLREIAEFLDGYSDVVDGSYGEPQPNKAMYLLQSVEQEIERLKRSSATLESEK